MTVLLGRANKSPDGTQFEAAAVKRTEEEVVEPLYGKCLLIRVYSYWSFIGLTDT